MIVFQLAIYTLRSAKHLDARDTVFETGRTYQKFTKKMKDFKAN